jgi:hypothetical protein
MTTIVSRAVVFARTSRAAARQSSFGPSAAAVPSAATATTATAAALASRSPRSGIDTSPTPAASATPPAATESAVRG